MKMDDVVTMILAGAAAVFFGIAPLLIWCMWQLRITDREIAERGILTPTVKLTKAEAKQVRAEREPLADR